MKSANTTPGYSPKKMKWDQSKMFNSKLGMMSMNSTAKETMKGVSIDATSSPSTTFPESKIKERR
jgi:hypothetical protein